VEFWASQSRHWWRFKLPCHWHTPETVYKVIRRRACISADDCVVTRITAHYNSMIRARVLYGGGRQPYLWQLLSPNDLVWVSSVVLLVLVEYSAYDLAVCCPHAVRVCIHMSTHVCLRELWIWNVVLVRNVQYQNNGLIALRLNSLLFIIMPVFYISYRYIIGLDAEEAIRFLEYWEHGFECHYGHGCTYRSFSVIMFYVGRGPVMVWSPVQGVVPNI
jgi:hypothetical protein